jgi:hypothetical protein
LTINIQPIERDGAFWVCLTMDGQSMEPHGPWSDINEAEAVAFRLAGICRVMHADVAVAAAGLRRSRHG